LEEKFPGKVTLAFLAKPMKSMVSLFGRKVYCVF
jgi:hypothetical protein